MAGDAITVSVPLEQARIIRNWSLEPIDGHDWRAHYRQRPGARSREMVALFEQLEAQREASEVTLTLPRELVERLGCGLANVAPEDDRREIRAGLDLLDQLEAR